MVGPGLAGAGPDRAEAGAGASGSCPAGPGSASSGWNGSITSIEEGACGWAVIGLDGTEPTSSGMPPCPKWVEIVGPSTLVAVARIACVVSGSVLEPRWTAGGWVGTITMTTKRPLIDAPVRIVGVSGVIEITDVELEMVVAVLSCVPAVRLFRSCVLTPLDPSVDWPAVGIVEALATALRLLLAAATRSGINKLATGLPSPVT